MDNLTNKEALYEEVMTAAEARKAGRIWLVTRTGMERVCGR